MCHQPEGPFHEEDVENRSEDIMKLCVVDQSAGSDESERIDSLLGCLALHVSPFVDIFDRLISALAYFFTA